MIYKYFILSLLLTIVFITSLHYTQQEERTQQPQLIRDQSLFPLQSTGIWTEVHPLIPRVIYFGVHFANEDTGWAVGEGGAIIKTTDGGGKWIWYESGVENTLKTVYSVNNGQRVIVAGDGGVLLISEDAGETWSALSSGTTDNIWNMQMITDEVGWMVGEGATALKTTDAGLSWLQQQMPHTTLPYWDISFADTNYGYIAGNNAIILKTTNGGTDWQIQIAGDYRSLFTVYAFDSLKVIAGGFAGKVVITTDGGSSWTQLSDIQSNVNRIKFFDPLNGFAATTGSNYQSTDGGYTWIYRPDLHNPSSTWNIHFPDLQNGYIVGARMQLMKTTDVGVSWNKTIINDDFLEVCFKDEQSGLINGTEKIYKTLDGGASLTVLESFPFPPRALTFIDSLTGFVSTNFPTRIFKTTNGGLSWFNTNISGLTDTTITMSKIFFLTFEIGWAVTGYPGTILKTTNRGNNWFIQLISGEGFSSIFFTDLLSGWATSRNIWQTNDGGNTWNEQINNNILYPYDIYFINDTTGICTEFDGLYKTIDKGQSWSLDSSIIGFGYSRIGYFDSYNIFIIGEKVYRTTNGGNTWIEFSELEGKSWRLAIKLLTVNSGYLVGNIGLIIKYYDESVPVELINFNGIINGSEVFLKWFTVTETNNQGFYIQRKKRNELEWVDLDFVEGKGNSTEINYYSYKDVLNETGVYHYRLKQTDFDGTFNYSKETKIEFSIPLEFKVFQNFPNPLNPKTNVRIILPEESNVTIKLYNSIGELVRTIKGGEFKAGIFDIELDLSKMSSGVYFYEVTAEGSTGIIYSEVNKMALTK